MALLITSKVPCNVVGFLSNKGEKPPMLKISSKRIAIRYDDYGIIILKPHIDRLIFGFSPTLAFMAKYQAAYQVDEYKEYIWKSLFHEAVVNGGNGFLSLINVPFKKSVYSNYNINLRYKPLGASEAMLIQAKPKGDSGRPFLRFDLNPSMFTAEAWKCFRSEIEALLVLPGVTVPYADFIAASVIYRCDIAVDILGVCPDILEITPFKGKQPLAAKSHLYKNAAGQVQTVYLDAKPGQSSKMYVYDKLEKQTENKIAPMYGNVLHSRFENRIQKTTFAKLPNVKNRCDRVSIRALNLRRFKKVSLEKRLFIRCALHRDFGTALDAITQTQKTRLYKAYASVMVDIWQPSKLWSYWKDAVADIGLFE
jgi:hypothetical protein